MPPHCNSVSPHFPERLPIVKNLDKIWAKAYSYKTKGGGLAAAPFRM